MKEMALKSTEVMEFNPSPKQKKGTLTPTEEDQGFLDTDCNDDS